MAFAAMSACGGGGAGTSYPTTPSSGTPGGTTGGGAPSSGNTVTLSESSFSPGSLAVSAGTTVTWQWGSCSDAGGYGGYATCVSHNVVFDDGVSSGVQSQGTFTRSFPNKGTFKYHCSIHGAGMSGQVTVQ
jgi:plastocyanin